MQHYCLLVDVVFHKRSRGRVCIGAWHVAVCLAAFACVLFAYNLAVYGRQALLALTLTLTLPLTLTLSLILTLTLSLILVWFCGVGFALGTRLVGCSVCIFVICIYWFPSENIIEVGKLSNLHDVNAGRPARKYPVIYTAINKQLTASPYNDM